MNKELSLEEIAKPYLILTEVAQKQGKTDLKSIILDRMIESMSSTQEVELIPMSKLVGILNLNSVKEIKEEIEKAEKEINYPVIDRHFKNFNNPVEVILNYIDKYYPTLYYAMYRDINPNGGLTKDIVTTYIKNKLSQTKPSLEEAIEVLCNALREDEGLFRAYKDNIAMSFKDECNRLRPVTNNWNRDIIHDIANNAAENFLNLLIQNNEKTTKTLY